MSILAGVGIFLIVWIFAEQIGSVVVTLSKIAVFVAALSGLMILFGLAFRLLFP